MFTDINLPPRMPEEDNNFVGSLVLEFRGDVPCNPRIDRVDCISYSNSQHKTHQIAQTRHVEPQKRQYTTSEVGLHLF